MSRFLKLKNTFQHSKILHQIQHQPNDYDYVEDNYDDEDDEDSEELSDKISSVNDNDDDDRDSPDSTEINLQSDEEIVVIDDGNNDVNKK